MKKFSIVIVYEDDKEIGLIHAIAKVKSFNQARIVGESQLPAMAKMLRSSIHRIS